jgi:hypothetical protein
MSLFISRHGGSSGKGRSVPTPSPALLSFQNAPSPELPLIATLTQYAAGGSWNLIEDGNVLDDTDATAPISPPNVIKYRWPIGYSGGIGVGQYYHALPNVTRVYVAAAMKLCANWQNHETGVSKLFYLACNVGSLPFVFRGGPSGPYEVYSYPQFRAGFSSGPWLASNINQCLVNAGDWFLLEVLVDVNEGEIDWWVNGTHAAHHTEGEPGIPLEMEAFVEYQHNSVWGGIDDTKDQEDYILTDHVIVRGE